MKSRFNKLERNKKLLTERGEKMKNDYHDIIAKADLIFDKLPKDKQDIILEAKKKQIAKEPRTMKVQAVSQGNSNMQSNSNSNLANNSNIDPGIPNSKEDKIRIVKNYLKMAGQPINVLDNEADINQIIAQMDKAVNQSPASEQDEMNKILTTMLKNKGIQDSDIKKGFEELNKKLKN
jgi:predicted nuclease with TOPRIM domain